MRPVVARHALGPVLHVGLSIVVNFVAVGAVLVFLVAKAAGVAEMENLALDEAVAPQRRIGGVAIRALMIFQACSRRSAYLLAATIGRGSHMHWQRAGRVASIGSIRRVTELGRGD